MLKNTSKLTHDQLKRVLPTGIMVGKEYETQCPLCSHVHLRLFGADGVKCMNGCDTSAVIAHLREKLVHMEKPKRLKPSQLPDWKGFTLADYCGMKRLSQLGLRVFFGARVFDERLESEHKGKPVVAFPYMDSAGKVLATKVRLSHDSHDTYFRPKDPHVPYGLWLYTNRPDSEDKWPQDIVICEGESDVQTLMLHNVSSIGISGAKGWRAEFANLPVIQNAERIFIVQEPDHDGGEFVTRVAKDLPPEKAFAIKLPEKDPSALHLKYCDTQRAPLPLPPDFVPTGDELADAKRIVRYRRELIDSGKWDPSDDDPFQREFNAAIAEALPFAAEEGGAAVNKRFRYTDTGNAEMLVAIHGENFRWLNDEGVFCNWNGSKWEKDKTGNALLPITKEVVRTIPDPEWQNTSESAGKRKAMIEMSKGEISVWARRELFDQRPLLLNVQNGTIDLETQELRPFCREDYITKQAPVIYDPSATCPKFDAFLDRIFRGDQELIHFIVKALGYSLTGSAKEQCFFFCYGTGANGKSTLFEVFRGLLGSDYAGTAGFSTFVEKKHQDASGYDIAQLPGRRMVTTVEPQKSGRLNEELLKLLTGDEVIKARQIYGTPFDFKPECKLWFAMNQQPRIAGTDEGIWRRVRLVPFSVQIPSTERVQGYAETLVREEGPGILNRLLEGVRDWLAEGLGEASAVRRATEDFRAAQDILQGFFNEYTIQGKRNQHVKGGVLYAAYKQWAEETGEFCLRQNEFFAEVKGRGFEQRDVRNDGSHYWGITLKATPKEDAGLVDRTAADND